jgi:hypothetical protein
MIDYFDDLEKEITEGLNKELISMGFDRLNYHIGLRKATYYLIGGFTGSGKTTFLDDAFVLNPYEFVLSPKNTKGLKLKIFYFSMERRKNYKIAKWISRKIFTDTGQIISVNKILGWVSKENKLTAEELEIVKSYKDYINTMLNNVVTIIENPQNPMGIKKTIDAYAEANGKKVKIDEHNYKYIPNDPNEHVIVIYDHIGLQKKETRSYPNGDKVRLSSKKEIIDQSSEDARKFRDVYGYTIVKISQFNRDISNPIRLKNGDVEPMLEDFKDSASTQEDSEVCIALFDPMRYKIPDPIGYNLEKLRNSYGNKMYRSIKILKNSYGSDDVRIGLAFNPVVGIFKEMPKVQDTTEETYKSIIDNTYFTQRKLTPLKELKL